jgi:hypothetical protein
MFGSSFPPGGLPLGGYPERLGGENVSIQNRAPAGFRMIPRGLGNFIGRTTIAPHEGLSSPGGVVASQVHSLFGKRSI